MNDICFVVPRYHPAVGGTEKLCQEVLESVAETYDVSVLTNPSSERHKHSYPYKIFNCAFGEKDKFNNIFSNYNFKLTVFFADLHTAYLNDYNVGLCKKNICVLNLDETTYNAKELFNKATENLKKFDLVVTFTKEGIANKYLEENKIKNVYIPNFSRDVLETKLETDYISKLKLDKNKKTIFYNAAYETRKNQLYVIEQINKSSFLKELNWIFIGAQADQTYLRKCIDVSAGIPNIRFLNSTTNTKTIDQLYQSCDCLLLASIAEGMPLVLLEALSANKPSVCTPVGGVKGVLKNVNSVIILPSIKFSIKDLEVAIQKQLDGIFDSRNIWNTNFRKDLICKQYKELFEKYL